MREWCAAKRQGDAEGVLLWALEALLLARRELQPVIAAGNQGCRWPPQVPAHAALLSHCLHKHYESLSCSRAYLMLLPALGSSKRKEPMAPQRTRRNPKTLQSDSCPMLLRIDHGMQWKLLGPPERPSTSRAEMCCTWIWRWRQRDGR